MTSLALKLPDILGYQFLHNDLWRWLALLGVLLVTFILKKTISLILASQSKKLADRGMEILHVILRSTIGPVALLIFAGGLFLSQTFLILDVQQIDDQYVNLTDGPIRGFWISLSRAISALAVGWFIYRLVDVIEYFLRRWMPATGTIFDKSLVILIRRSLRVFIIIVAALFIAQNIFKWDIGALLAGLGIGGLALALAAQNSLSNLFGCITIFADKPFAIGQRIKAQGFEGTVLDIGFRSTRIQTLEGHLVTIPNGLMAQGGIENIGIRPHLRKIMNITVTYDTPPEKLQRAVAILREMLDARLDRFNPELPPRVYFDNFNADSLNIFVIFWFVPADWWMFLEFCHDLNLEILRRFNDEGIEFAFPTRTLYLRPEGRFPIELPEKPPL